MQTRLLAFHTSRLPISDVFRALSADRFRHAATDTRTQGEISMKSTLAEQFSTDTTFGHRVRMPTLCRDSVERNIAL